MGAQRVHACVCVHTDLLLNLEPFILDLKIAPKSF